MKKSNLILLFCFTIILAFPHSSWTAGYPSRDIKVIVPWGAGGGSDLDTRLMCKYMSKYLGVGMFVVNIPGGGTTIGIKNLMKSDPDGYTIGSGITSANLSLYPKIVKGAGFGIDAITPLFFYDMVPMALVVRADSPWKSLADFVADAKKHPGQYKHGSVGAVSIGNIVFEMINHYAGTQTRHVPFKSTGETLTAILGGHVDITFAFSLGGGLMEAGKIRVLAVASPERMDLLPNVPSLKELGYPVFYHAEHGMFCPNGTPRGVQDILVQAGKRAFEEHGKQMTKEFADISLVSSWGDQKNYEKVLVETSKTYDYFIDVLKLPTYPTK